MIVSEIIISSRIIEKVTAKTTFGVQQFIYGQKNLQSSYYKTKSAAIAFFSLLLLSSPLSFFFSFPFPSLVWFWSLYRAQETCLLRPFHSKGGKFR